MLRCKRTTLLVDVEPLLSADGIFAVSVKLWLPATVHLTGLRLYWQLGSAVGTVQLFEYGRMVGVVRW